MQRRQIEFESDVDWLHRCPKDQVLSAAEFLLLKKSAGSEGKYWDQVLSRKLPEYAQKRLIQFASEPRVVKRRYGLHGGYELSDLTDEVWDDLARLRSKQFAKLLRKFIKHPNSAIRCEAGHRLAWLAFDGDARLLVSAARQDWRVAENILIGFQLAHKFKRPSRRFMQSVDVLARQIVAGSLHPRIGYELSDAIEVLRLTDQVNANRFLLSSECLHLQNRQLWNILLRFEMDRDDGRRTPLIEPRLLWKLYDEAARRVRRSEENLSTGLDGVLGMLLMEGVRVDPVRARGEVHRLKSRSEVQSGSSLGNYVSQAVKLLRGVPSPNAVLARAEKRMKKLSGKARSVLHAKRCGEDLYNDSLESYLQAYTADVVSACEGLRVIGLPKYASTLKRCHAAFVAGGKSLDIEAFVKNLPGALRRDVKNLDRNGRTIINAALDFAEKHSSEFE